MRCRALLLAACLPLLARAQEQVWTHVVDAQQVCSVQTVFHTGGTGLGAGFVRVDAIAVDAAPHRIELAITSPSWIDHDLALRRTIRLGPGERTRFHLPLPNTNDGRFDVRVTIDGVRYEGQFQGGRVNESRALLISDRSEQLAHAVGALQRLSGAAKPDVTSCAAIDVPADWRMYTGFAVVFVDGRSELDGPQQESLRRFVHAGGTVAIGNPHLLPAGPLRALGEAAMSGGSTAHGLGRCLALDATFRGAGGEADRLPGDGGAVWPATSGLGQPLEIPGLGRAPITVFLLVILAFAVAAGPVNFVLLRRRKQPMLALLTVPVLGFGTTVAMLLFGVLHDGFGVRGAGRSWSLLDQRRHEVSATAVQALFAGFTPGEVTMTADELLLAPLAQLRVDRRSPHRWHFDADRNTLDGGVLPSRTVTPLLTGVQAAARERLRVRERADGGLDLVVDGALAPQGEVVVRGRDGRYWVGTGSTLHPCDEPKAGSVLRSLRSDASFYLSTSEDGGTTQVQVPWVHAFGGRELPLGSYFARFAAPPWWQGRGIAVDDFAAEHWVLGLLAPEDFLP